MLIDIFDLNKKGDLNKKRKKVMILPALYTSYKEHLHAGTNGRVLKSQVENAFS